MELWRSVKTAGRWLGLTAVLLAPPVLFGSQLWTAYRGAQERTECRRNLHHLARALAVYSCDYGKTYGDHWGKYLPAAGRWPQAVKLYASGWNGSLTGWAGGDLLSCPTLRRQKGPGAGGYAFNAALSESDPRLRTPSSVPLFWEAAPGTLASDDLLGTLPDPPRHVGGTHNVVFLDSHVVSWTWFQARAFEAR